MSTTTITANRHHAGAADRQVFELYGRHLTHTTTAETQNLLATAHDDRTRPMCMCRPNGVPMYVAKIGAGKYVIKRMPDTGLAHAHRCPSYLPPEELSGLGQVVGSAITEEPDSGLTAIRLGFRMSKGERPAAAATCAGTELDSVADDPNRLSLRAVLHYLWQQAELTTWSPRMAGKRNWRIVSWYLRQAAAGKFTGRKPLAARMFVPEPFTTEKKAEIAARRLSAWAPAQKTGTAQHFMLLIGELKATEPARFGHKIVVKHLPDAPLMVDDTLYKRLTRRFGAELELWQIDEDGHLMIIATFSVGRGGLATAEEISLVMTDRNWLPYESQIDKLLLDVAIEKQRRFTKTLRYNLPPAKPMASLVFTDTEKPTAAFLLTNDDERATIDQIATQTGTDTWCWIVGHDMPALPAPVNRHQSSRL